MPTYGPADGGHSLSLAEALTGLESCEGDSSWKNPCMSRTGKMTQGPGMLSIITTSETKVTKSKGGTITEIPFPALPTPTVTPACVTLSAETWTSQPRSEQ